MAHIQIRFNKSRGQPGRGTPDHAWRGLEVNRAGVLQITLGVCSLIKKNTCAKK